MEDVKVFLTGTGNGGLQPGTEAMATTPGGQPNVVIEVIKPIVTIAVRFGHLMFVTAAGILTAAGADKVTGLDVIPFTDFQDLLWKAAYVGACVAFTGAVKDFGTLFGKLESKFPFLTGNV